MKSKKSQKKNVIDLNESNESQRPAVAIDSEIQRISKSATPTIVLDNAELEVSLTSMMSFSFGFPSMGVIVALPVTLPYGLTTGGPVIAIWGWLVDSFFTLLITSYMAEMCKSHPGVGSVYHWTAMYSPSQEWAPFLSYICGWLNLTGNIAFLVANASLMGLILSSSISLMSIGKTQASVQMQVLLSIASLALWGCKNLLNLQNQGNLQIASMFFTIFSFIIYYVVLIFPSKELSSYDFVFTEYINYSGYTNDQLVYLLGICMSTISFTGLEGCATMAQETKKGAAP